MDFLPRLLLTFCLAALMWLAPSHAFAGKIPSSAGLCGADGTSLHVRAQVQGCVPYEAPREAAGLCARTGQTRVESTPVSRADDQGSLSRSDAPCGPRAEQATSRSFRSSRHVPCSGELDGSVAEAAFMHPEHVPMPALRFRLLTPLRHPAAGTLQGLDDVLSLERPPRA